MAIPANQQISPTEKRLAVPQQSCDVLNRRNLESYRSLYRKWMGWYEYTSENPNTIEGQIMNMMFHDLTYRSITSIRASLSSEAQISARSSTLAYITDSGYLANQVLAVSKLVDSGSDVVSVLRLVKDIQGNRKSITREVYVAGFGAPYDPMTWREKHDENDPMVQIWGLQAPGLSRWLQSHYAHERFDVLSGSSAERRSREEVIQPAIFQRIIEWLSIPEIKELKSLRDNFLAHAGDALKQGDRRAVQSVRFNQLDKAQEAIIRAERAITDCLLSLGIARDVVGFPPLGIFSGLDIPYSTKAGQDKMHARWDELKAERETWKDNILQALVNNNPKIGRLPSVSTEA